LVHLRLQSSLRSRVAAGGSAMTSRGSTQGSRRSYTNPGVLATSEPIVEAPLPMSLPSLAPQNSLGTRRRRGRSQNYSSSTTWVANNPDPAVVLVSNNPYAVSRPLATGTRPRLDSGRLDRRPRRATPGRGSSRAGLDRHPARAERGSAGSCRRRRRGGRPPRFARVRDPARRAPRQDLSPSSGRVAVGPDPVTRTRTRGGAQRRVPQS
jgi:hypothetical protein